MKYLGDACYATEENGMIRLVTNYGYGDNQVIYLELEVFLNLVEFGKDIFNIKQETQPMKFGEL